MRSKAIAVLCIVLCLALVACGGGKAPTSAPPAPTSAPAGKPASIATNTPLPAAQPTAAQDEELPLSEASNLSKLRSYRTHYTMAWQSTDQDGEQESGNWDMKEELVREPPARHVTWTGTGTGDEGDVFELIQIGNDTYLYGGEEWIAMQTGEESLFDQDEYMSNPFAAIADAKGKLVKRGESVNGVSCDHYVFDEKALGGALGMATVAKANGDTWVSTEFKVVIKYTAHYEGTGVALSSSEGEGIIDFAFDLTDINKPITIQPPEGVKPAMPQDIPVIAGATELSAMSGMVSFTTDLSLQEVLAYYAAQMPLQGWTQGESPTPEMISFTKDNRTAQFMLSEEDGKTSVVIIVTEE